MKKAFIFIWTVQIAVFSYCQQKADIFSDSLNTTPIKIAGGYSFTEGPSVDRSGRVFFTDQPNDKIFVWDENKGVSVFKDSCERCNGTYFDKKGNLITCADLNNTLISFSKDGSKKTIFSSGFNGKHLNGPNDLWIDKKGGIYFTDPYFQRPYWSKDHKQLLDTQAVYYLQPSGKIIRLITDLQQPNGIVGTPDGKTLYIADMRGRTTWKYTIAKDGSLSNKSKLLSYGSDGMTIDKNGNIYITSGKVHIFNKNGEKIAEIQVPEMPSNLCFGGKERNVLFITARTSVYKVMMKVKGVE